MSTINNKTYIIHEPINDDYEWIQYNNELRIIRSIKDDMYQMKSIIRACNSKKLSKDWFKNETTNELIQSLNDEINIEREFPFNKKMIH